MTVETVGSFLPDESLIAARNDFERGLIDRRSLTTIEDAAVCEIVERQLTCGVPFITSGELRRKHWAYDFWFGLDGISCENISAGRIYQPIETSTDHLHVTGRIGYNPAHPFFDDFRFLHEAVAGRAKCRQTLPSPANLLLEIYDLSDGRPEILYPAPIEAVIEDIAEAYRLTAIRLAELGCESLQYDDTALGLMCEDNYTTRLLQGGVDFIRLHSELISCINMSLESLPCEMEKSIYISGGDTIVPEWEYIEFPDNIMPKALSSLHVDKFFLPFDSGNDYALQVLRHLPKGKSVVLGVADAHTPFPENPETINEMISKVIRLTSPNKLSISHRTGFKLSSYDRRALLYEDQWRKISELSAI